ncbi:unnamed protein product [Clonostachys rosea]|uniref:Uncharacterized protein n=1 Tax=Bionectria ochroleuca TaxID=29856 RepID=A0ABY6ULE6_BIOOC|nr:unnamed protein product [Clonostachys rosea]
MTYDHQRKDSGLFPRHDAPGGRARRDRGLQDMSKEAVAQLTSILIMPPNETIAYPSEEWLKDQKVKISNADWPLRRRYSLSATISSLGRSFHMPTRAGRADLCASHVQLDPRVIHHLKHLIVHLCDQKLERLREDYHGTPHHPDVISWLDRLECIRSVCLDENGINEQSPMDDGAMEQDPWWTSRPAGTKEGNLKNVQSYRVVKKGIRNLLSQNVTRKTTCAACICAAVGGDRSMLADLFAGVWARQMVEKTTDSKKKKRRPKLLRVLKHWARHYDERRQNRIRRDARHLKPLIAAALEQADHKSGHSERTRSPSLQSEKDDMVFDPNILHMPEHTTAPIPEEHLGSTTSRQSWVVPVYLSPHVEELPDLEEEHPGFREPFQRDTTRVEDCASSEEYAETIQVDPFQNNRAYVEEYPSLDEDYAQPTHADLFLSQKVYTTNLDGLRGSAVPPPLKIRPPQINIPPLDSDYGTRKQSWATVSVHTARQSEVSLSLEDYPPPPIPSFLPAETYQRRPVSSVYDAEGGNPPPSPSVATSKLPYAPNGRMISMVDYNPKHLNQQALKALEGRATIVVGRDSIPAYLFPGGRRP